MVYDHTVIKDGIVYVAGKDVPNTKKVEETKSPVVETPVEEKPAKRGRPPKSEE